MWGKRGLDCRRAQELIEQMLDGEASAGSASAAGRHLERCPDCQAYRRAIARQMGMLAGLSREIPPADFVASVMSRLSRETRPAGLRWLWVAAPAAAALAAALLLWPRPHQPAPSTVARNRPPTPMAAQPASGQQRAAAPNGEAKRTASKPERGEKPVRTVRRPNLPHHRRVEWVRHPKSGQVMVEKPKPTQQPAPTPAELIEIADNYEASGQLDQALSAYQQAQSKQPSPSLELAVARIHDKLGDTYEAVASYAEAALGKWPENGQQAPGASGDRKSGPLRPPGNPEKGSPTNGSLEPIQNMG